MDRKIISRRIADIQNSLSRLNNNICAMDSLDIQRYPENYETMSTEAALRAEGIACQLRSLLYASTSVSKAEYLVQAGEVHGIEILYENGILVNPKVNKDLFSGISVVKSYFNNAEGKARLFIFKNCTNLIREIKNYWWGDGDVPLKKDDHALDELRYYLMTKPNNILKTSKTEIQKDKEKMIKALKNKKFW